MIQNIECLLKVEYYIHKSINLNKCKVSYSNFKDISYRK